MVQVGGIADMHGIALVQQSVAALRNAEGHNAL